MGSRFPVNGASGGGRWLAVLLGFFLALLSTLEAIPTRGAAGYLEMSLGGRTYDGLNRVTSYTEAGETIGYRYYASGKLAKAIYPGGTENGLGHVEYTYNADGRLYQVIDRLSSTSSPRTTTYSWNSDGRLASVARPNGTVRTISYDTAGRPSGISDAGIVWGVGYWPSDDIKTLDVTPPVPARRLAPVPAAAMTFDDSNGLLTFNGQTIAHDADGNSLRTPLPAGGWADLTYDSRNRLRTKFLACNEYGRPRHNQIGERSGGLTALPLVSNL